MTEFNLNLAVNYRDISGTLFCHPISGGILAFKIPRGQSKAMLEKFPESGCDTFRHKGCVYILYGEETTGEKAYIGETMDIDTRLIDHTSRSKDWRWWEEILIFCRNDDVFETPHIKYVERQLILKAREGRIPLQNRNIGVDGINARYESAANDFTEKVQLICGALGYKLFEPMPTAVEVSQSSSYTAQPQSDFLTFSSKASEKYKAIGGYTGVGKTFMVFAGSTMSPDETDTCPTGTRGKRKELQTSEIVDNNFRFVKDYVFRSPATAARVIYGGSISAKVFWEGLEEFLESQEQAEASSDSTQL